MRFAPADSTKENITDSSGEVGVVVGGGGEFNGRGIPLCEEWFWRPPRTGCHVLEGGSFGFHLHVLLSRLVVIIFTISCTRKHILKISEQVARQNNSPW